MAPGKPTNLRWTRRGDTALTLMWDGGAGASRFQIAWQQTPQGRVTEKWITPGRSFAIHGMPANSAFAFVVNAWDNSGGQSGWSGFTSWFYTPGPAPVGLSAASTADGILVSWRRDGAYFVHGAEVEVSVGGVVSGTVLLGNGTNGAAPTTYLDSASGGQVSYRVRGFVGAPGAQSRVFSAWSAPVTIMHRVPPAAPRGLGPGSLVAKGSVTFSWEHSPRDGSAQTGAEVRYRPVGGSSWTTKTGGATSSLTVTGFTPGEFEFQVRTRGLVAEFGDWSPTAVFEAVTLPLVNITQPAVGSNSIGLVSAAWTYTQLEGKAMTAWRAELWEGPALLEQAAGVGTQTSVSFNTRLMNNTGYEVRVWAETGGVRSATAKRAFTVAFTKPAKPVLDVVWNDLIGAHEVTVKPGVGGAATVEMDVEFSVDGGHSWVPMALGLPPLETALATFEGRSVGSTLFRATAFTSLGALDETVVEVTTDSGAAWIAPTSNVTSPLRVSHGDDGRPQIDANLTRKREVVWYDGREEGVTYAEQHVKGSISMRAALLDDSPQDATREDVEALAASGETTVYARFPTGHIVRGAFTVALTQTKHAVWGVTMSVEVTKVL